MPLIKLLLLVSCCTLLCSCASLGMLSVGLSGVSYAVSGKSLSDHALSMFVAKDCVVHRALFHEVICQAWQNDEAVLARQNSSESVTPQVWRVNSAAKTALQQSQQQTGQNAVNSSSSSQSEPAESTVAENIVAENIAAPDFGSSAIKASNIAQSFVVIGSFNNWRFAQERQQQYKNSLTKIIKNQQNEKTLYRVVVGPIEQNKLAATLAKFSTVPLSTEQLLQPWQITLCTDNLGVPPCEATITARL